jgi:acetoin utilization protein AcuB
MTKLSDALTKQLITIAWDRSLEEAEHLMKENRIRHLAVTDELGRVYAVLSDRDVARAKLPLREGFAENVAVCTFASSPVIAVTEKTTLAEVCELMMHEKISCVLVAGEGDRIAGIVTSEDLLWVLASRLRAEEGRRAARVFPALTLVGELLRELGSAGI